MEFQLRPFRPEDAEALAKAADNPKIAANLRNVFPHPYTLEDAKWFINDCISKGDSHGFTWAIEVEDKAAGCIAVNILSDVYEKSAELGYWLSEEYWRHGIMSRTVPIICREAFKAFDIIRISAEPFAYNAGSRGVLEKAGFTFEGTMRNGIYKNGQVHSYCIYSLLKEELEL